MTSLENPFSPIPDNTKLSDKEKLARLQFLEKQLQDLNKEKDTVNKALVAELEAEEVFACEKSLFAFYQAAWPIFETGDFLPNWHMHVIAEALEALEDGQISNLILQVPPGCGKSTLSCVAYPAWGWLKDPTLRFMTASVTERLVLRDAVRTRNLINSEWYQKNWGERFALTKGSNAKSKYENSANGYRLATSVGGSAIGERFDRLCFPYDTYVLTDKGIFKIGDIVTKKLNVKVLTYNLNSEKQEWSNIRTYQKNPFRPLIKITNSKGVILTCTEDHKIWEESTQSYIKAKDLIINKHLIRSNKNEKLSIVSVERVDTTLDNTYNLCTESNNHNYFASNSSATDFILVANCIDDPHKPSEITSQLKKDAVWDWFSQTLSTRASARGKRILIHQRLAVDDLIGRVLESEEDWEVVNLPMEYEFNVSYAWTDLNILPNKDPRTKEGELLFPQVKDRKAVDKLKKILGTYGTAAQLQQRPVSLEGGLVKRKWFSYYSISNLVSFFTRSQMTIGGWDLSFGSTGGSHCVGEVWSLQEGYKKYLVDEYRGKWDWNQQKKAIWQMITDYPQIRTLLIEKKANGDGIIASLKSEMAALKIRPVNIIPVEVNKSKEVRLYMCLSDFEAGNVHILNPASTPWVDDYVEELITFPVGKSDDRVDVTTMVLNYLAQSHTIQKSVIITKQDLKNFQEKSLYNPSPEDRIIQTYSSNANIFSSNFKEAKSGFNY